MEIEKKFLVKEVPKHLEQYEKWEIEQCYLCQRPTIRARKKNDDYILTYKCRTAKEQGIKDVNVSIEEELPLTEDAYLHLRDKADGIVIAKTRYRIPYGKYMVELDVFHGEYEGFFLAEVEFPTVEESRSFMPPEWFGDDVSGNKKYTNSYMATQESKKNL